jgi:hypothetical protein
MLLSCANNEPTSASALSSEQQAVISIGRRISQCIVIGTAGDDFYWWKEIRDSTAGLQRGRCCMVGTVNIIVDGQKGSRAF